MKLNKKLLEALNDALKQGIKQTPLPESIKGLRIGSILIFKNRE